MFQSHVYYSGIVQGVGFRYTVKRLACDSGISGWVRNLSDGRVELIAQGSKNEIQNFLLDIDRHFKDYIKSKTVDYTQGMSNFSAFEIRPSF